MLRRTTRRPHRSGSQRRSIACLPWIRGRRYGRAAGPNPYGPTGGFEESPATLRISPQARGREVPEPAGRAPNGEDGCLRSRPRLYGPCVKLGIRLACVAEELLYFIDRSVANRLE